VHRSVAGELVDAGLVGSWGASFWRGVTFGNGGALWGRSDNSVAVGAVDGHRDLGGRRTVGAEGKVPVGETGDLEVETWLPG
jgi:hypothetical protein